jgi:hypothetical protein
VKTILALLALAAALPLQAVTVVPLVGPKAYFTDNNGKPCSGCKLWTYLAGTTTPQLTYSDPAGTVANTNPILLDASGRADIFIIGNPYKFVLETKSDLTHGTVLWTQDNYTAGSIAGVTFPVSVPNGGTGLATISDGALMLGNGTAAVATLAPGAPLTYLRSKPNVLTPAVEFAAMPTFIAADYNFPALTPAQALTGATPATVTLAPCPLGVNGSDSHHVLYITGASAEGVLITGGTCTSGAASGTVTLTPAFSHTLGAWTLVSAAAGIPEALQAAATASGGTVLMPNGVTTQHGLLNIPARTWLQGYGSSGTTLRVASGEFAAGQAWNYPASFVVAIVAGSVDRAKLSDFTLDMAGSSQTSVPTNTGDAILIGSSTNTLVRDLNIIRSPNPASFGPLTVLNGQNNLVDHVSIINDPLTGCTNSGAAGFFIQGGIGHSVINSYGEAGCQSMFVAGTSSVDIVFANDTYNIGTTTMAAQGQQFINDSGSNIRFEHDTCIGNGTAPACFTTATDATTISASHTDFTDCVAITPGVGFQFSGFLPTATSNQISVKGGRVYKAGTAGVFLQDGIDGLSISGLQVDGNTTSPFGLFSSTATAGGMKNIVLTGNHFLQNTTGIQFTGTAGLIPATGLVMQGNDIFNNTTGVSLPSATAINHFLVVNNLIYNNTADLSIGITNGIASLVTNGIGIWGPNVTSSDTTFGQSALGYGASGNVFAATTLANGLNSNIATNRQGSLFLSGPSGAFSIGGFTNGYDGQELYVYNSTSQTMTVVNADASSAAANRISTLTGANVVLPAASNSWAKFKYCLTCGSVWILSGHS